MKLIFRGKVVIADVNEDAGEKIAKEFNKLLQFFINRCKKVELTNKLIDKLTSIVINNAAITDVENGMLKYSLEEPTHFSKLIEINLMGVIYGHYFTKSMSQVSELHNITINAACPSVTRTEMTAGAIGVPDRWWSPIDDVVEAYNQS
ncbi:unnamed protein product [Rhizophagus irregularis]|uniref:NAD(P)-binding protein n=2 Tax=Rhizophagus irregularis TaxID=588596 RepID=A0A916E6T9_9GLOM|nr:unnamed protein product [Rhizophagus irregularis]CAB5364261.1 unnamed protein product [Rhizophagus irregularis]